jgi:hypothetical protein
MSGMQRFTDEVNQRDFLEKIHPISRVRINFGIGEDGNQIIEEFDASFLAKGGFGATIRIETSQRPLVLKLYFKGGIETNFHIVREAKIHNEIQLRMGLRFIPVFSDTSYFKVNSLEDGTLNLESIPSSSEIIGQDLIATIQDFAPGTSLTQWNAEDIEDLTEVFKDYGLSLDTMRAHGVADADRNPNNTHVLPKHLSQRTRIIQIDFGTATLVSFDVRTLFALIRNPHAFKTPKERLLFLARIFTSLAQRRYNKENDIPTPEGMTIDKLQQMFKWALLSLTKTTVPKEESKLISDIEDLSDENVELRLMRFESVLNWHLPIESQPYINAVLGHISFSQDIAINFSHRNLDVNWQEVLGQQINSNVESMYWGEESSGFGHYLSPCPATLLGLVEFKDFEKMAVCANYQMMWTLFRKLGLDLVPIDFTQGGFDPNAEIIKAFVDYYIKKEYPIVSKDQFLHAAQTAPKSLLKGYSVETLSELYYFFKDFFDRFHYTEVLEVEESRLLYRNARDLISRFETILNTSVTSNPAAEG